MKVDIGMEVMSGDDVWGKVRDVVVDRSRTKVTHLVVEPRGRHTTDKLVPIDRFSEAGPGVLAVSGDAGELDQAFGVDESDYVPVDERPSLGEGWNVDATRILAPADFPYIEAVAGQGAEPYPVSPSDPLTTVDQADLLRDNRAEIRRSSEVWSSDGTVVGRVEGFVLDDAHNVTHVVLEHGHLWGRREICIPSSGVKQVNSDWIDLSLTKDQVGALPEVKFRRNADR
jgi:sporulation protein YlmC with PRC-barrel domain